MPTPRKNESKNSYISRCVREVMKEGKTQKQTLGQCYGMWQQHKKKKAKGTIELDNGDEMIIE